MQASMLDRDAHDFCFADRHQACPAAIVARHAGAVERSQIKTLPTQSAGWAAFAVPMERVVSHFSTSR